MNKIQNILIELMKISLISENINNISISKEEWTELLKLIIDQGMGAILFPVINFLSDESKPDHILFDKWKNQLLFMVMLQLHKTEQLKKIINTLNSADLPFIVIKGPAIARLYNNPEYRLMSDLDILVEEKNMPFAQQVIEAMDYTLVVDKDQHLFHLGYSKPGDLYIELHYGLLSPDIQGHRKINKWYEHIWGNRKLISFEGIDFYIMAEEDELIQQVFHCARHMISEGARMNNIYEMCLLIRHYEKQFDWQYFHDQIKSLNILGFGALISEICNTYFDFNTPESPYIKKRISPEQFFNIFFDYYSVPTGNTTEYKFTWSYLVHKAPFLCKSLITIPVVYIIDFITQLTRNKKSVRDSIIITHNNMKWFSNNIQILKTLGAIR